MTDTLEAIRARLAREAEVELLTVQEYADRYRLHIQTVYRAIKCGRLPFQVERPAGGAIRIAIPRAERRIKKQGSEVWRASAYCGGNLMPSIRDQERETYETMWNVPTYANYSPGERYLPVFLDMTAGHDRRGAEVLDAGCGSGKGAVALAAAGFDVRCCDLTAEGLVDEAKGFRFTPVCLWQPDFKARLGAMHGGAVDWVYCCDVMEHVPTPFTMLTVANLLRVARRGVFLSIALGVDYQGAWIGKALHQTVQGFAEWRDQLREVGRVTDARDLIQVGVYMVQPC